MLYDLRIKILSWNSGSWCLVLALVNVGKLLTSNPRFPIDSKEANNTFSYLFRAGCGSNCLA